MNDTSERISALKIDREAATAGGLPASRPRAARLPVAQALREL